MNNWTQKEITDWAVKTFGMPKNPLALVRRAEDEFDELYSISTNIFNDQPLNLDQVDKDHIVKEITDIFVVLSQVVEHLGYNLQDEINKTMNINVNRTWNTDGSGTGQHA